MSGSIGLSLTQRYDKTSHEPLDAGKIYFYAAGTSTPQNAFQDVSLTIPWPNPLTLDSGGNVPYLYFADGYIKFRIANAAGTTQIEADYVLVMGPTSGVGAAPSVDATTIYQTGDLKVRYGTGTHDGWVRANGRTIGSATSGATERANSDTQTLFEHLWTADANLSVSTGRGASANADWVANKNIALPDWRDRAIAGLGDMGNSDAGRLTTTYFGTSPIVLGAASTPTESKTLLTANLPPYTPTGTGTIPFSTAGFNVTGGGTSLAQQTSVTAVTITMDAQGGVSTPFSIVQPTMLATIYVKL